MNREMKLLYVEISLFIPAISNSVAIGYVYLNKYKYMKVKWDLSHFPHHSTPISSVH